MKLVRKGKTGRNRAASVYVSYNNSTKNSGKPKYNSCLPAVQRKSKTIHIRLSDDKTLRACPYAITAD